jgi:hypothetical protein
MHGQKNINYSRSKRQHLPLDRTQYLRRLEVFRGTAVKASNLFTLECYGIAIKVKIYVLTIIGMKSFFYL